MYGDKEQKNNRLNQMVAIIRQAGNITQTALARMLGVSRSVVNKDLVTLHRRGIRLAEDGRGRLSLPDRE